MADTSSELLALADEMSRRFYAPVAVPAWVQKIRAIAEREAWQPIKTAPKNKKIIVVYRNAFGILRRVLARYYGLQELPVEETNIDDDSDGYAPEGWYEDCEENGYAYALSGDLIAWMPLPEPPEDAP